MIFHESLNQERKFSLAIPLVFIAILGGTTGVVGLATVLSPQASYAVNSQSQLAQSSAVKSYANSPQNCEEAIKRALGDYKDPPAPGLENSQKQGTTLDACFGAVLDSQKSAAPNNRPENYKCVGRRGQINVGSTVTTLTRADPFVDKGYCEMVVCNSKGEQCKEAELFGSGQTIPVGTGESPKTPPATTNDA